jgi:hypothetical protein
MKKKIFAISSMIIFVLILAIPLISAEETMETPTPLFNKMSLAHIKIDGIGTSTVIAGDFTLGFGRCAYMRFNLDEGSHIEINKFLDRTNMVTLDDDHIVTIFGFVGYFKETETDITLNGFTTLVFWR